MINYGLFVRNAKACENAKRSTCKCFCGGALHGKSHDGKLAAAWIKYVEEKKHLVKTPQQPTP